MSYIANPQESTKKALVVEERRKILEKYLNDLAANPFVGRTELWRDFIGEVEEYAMNVHDSPLKENTKKVANGATQSPE